MIKSVSPLASTAPVRLMCGPPTTEPRRIEEEDFPPRHLPKNPKPKSNKNPLRGRAPPPASALDSLPPRPLRQEQSPPGGRPPANSSGSCCPSLFGALTSSCQYDQGIKFCNVHVCVFKFKLVPKLVRPRNPLYLRNAYEGSHREHGLGNTGLPVQAQQLCPGSGPEARSRQPLRRRVPVGAGGPRPAAGKDADLRRPQVSESYF